MCQCVRLSIYLCAYLLCLILSKFWVGFVLYFALFICLLHFYFAIWFCKLEIQENFLRKLPFVKILVQVWNIRSQVLPLVGEPGNVRGEPGNEAKIFLCRQNGTSKNFGANNCIAIFSCLREILSCKLSSSNLVIFVPVCNTVIILVCLLVSNSKFICAIGFWTKVITGMEFSIIGIWLCLCHIICEYSKPCVYVVYTHE